MAKILWNPTAFTVGKEILESALKIRKQALMRRREEAAEAELSARKLAYWHSWSSAEKHEIVTTYSTSVGGCFQKYVEKYCLGDLDGMHDNAVLLFFGAVIPPFVPEKKSDCRIPPAA